jgi:hypothetical protein
MDARVTKAARVWARFLEVLGEAAISPEPREGALDHPATRDDHETVHVVAPLDDLHAQHWHLSHGRFNLPRVVAAIGPVNSSQRKRRRIFSRTKPALSRS